MGHLRTYRRCQDRLSSLPDALLITILSLLPTRIAARTSVLSHRFLHLWQQCPSLDLVCAHWMRPQHFVSMYDCALLRRDHPLLRLCLDFRYFNDLEFISQLLEKAKDLGLRHLKIEACALGIVSPFSPPPPFLRLFHAIFFIPTLESLSLPTLSDFPYLSRVPLTLLTSLSLGVSSIDPAKFDQFISDLCSLVDLNVHVGNMERLSISSKTIRKLKLKHGNSPQQLDILMLCLPSLELLHFESFYVDQWPLRFQGDIPLLRKVVLTLVGVRKSCCSGVPGLINYVSHVEELILHVKECHLFETTPFPILLEPGTEAPNFPNLKHLEATMCFHEHNFQAVVSMLRHSPALHSVKLVHEARETYPKLRRKKDWTSKLPRNADGNHRFTHLTNLHLGENSKQFAKLLKKGKLLTN